MQCLSNSQDVIGNSRSAREHTVASGTARQSRDPSLWSPGSLCASQWHWESWVLPWLSLQQLPWQPWLWLSSRTPGTSLPRAVCGVTRVSHPCLPHPAFPCGMHGRALLTVEHLGEGFKVLQGAHHPKQREGTHLHGNCCSEKQRELCPESGLEPQNSITVQNMGYFRKQR